MEDSTTTTGSGPPSSSRSARGSIAAQACETCRARKQKCDEARPQCSLCSRMKIECRYREPVPTKKDKTLVEILDHVKNIESMVSRIPPNPTTPAQGFGPAQPTPSTQPTFSSEADMGSYSTSSLRSSLRSSQQQSPSGAGRAQAYRHASAAHKILTWPSIQQLLLQVTPANVGDLKTLEQEGSAFIIRIQRGRPPLSREESLQESPFLGMQSRESRVSGGTRLTFPQLSREMMHTLATTYFDTFNLLYPFMDRQNFMSDTLTRVQSEGFDGDPESVIALLVFALGEVAIDGSRGKPIEQDKNGRYSGVRGGSILKPPGLAFFNEARKRIGFVLTGCELETVQIYSLMALYYQSCFSHQDFWRMSVAASLACQVLITSQIDYNSARGDLIRRAFWHCAINDSSLHLDLDISPSSRLASLEDQVGMPSFNTPFCEADHVINEYSHFLEYYASCTALRRLCATIHTSIYESVSSPDISRGSNDDFGGPSADALSQLALQLDQFRSMLPQRLQWSEDDPAGFPSPQLQPAQTSYGQPVDPSLSPSQPPHPRTGVPLFTVDLNREPKHYPYAYDIQVALLRTRYYYVKYMVYRPFIYKALHFPADMSQVDAEGAAECLRSCLLWPLMLSPTSRRKRLVPYLFCWSQNFLGILLIFHMTKHNPMLRDIRNQLCGPRFEAEYETTVELMIDWIKDLRHCDAIASWCWKILQPIYNLEP